MLDTETSDSRAKAVCKGRGIILNYNATRMVNFEVIRDMILRGTGDETTTANVRNEKKIKRKTKGGITSIVTEPEDRRNRISFFKRRRLGDNTSVPFGSKQGRLSRVVA